MGSLRSLRFRPHAGGNGTRGLNCVSTRPVYFSPFVDHVRGPLSLRVAEGGAMSTAGMSRAVAHRLSRNGAECHDVFPGCAFRREFDAEPPTTER